MESMETMFSQYPTPRATFSKKWPAKYDLSIVTEEKNGHYNDVMELQRNKNVVTPQPRKLVCPSPAGPPPQNIFKFDAVDVDYNDSKARQAEDEIMGIFFRDFEPSGIEMASPDDDNLDTDTQAAFFKRLTSSPCPPPTRDFTTPVPIVRRPSLAANRLASPFPMGTPPGRVANPVPLNSAFDDTSPIGAELGLLSLSPPVNKGDVILQHKRVSAVMNRQRSLSLGDNPRAVLLGKA